MLILGIETSCDETSAALVSNDESGSPRLVEQVLLSQAAAHEKFGGVVPEIACRSHVEALTRVIDNCLDRAQVKPSQLDGIAVASRPGLIGALLIGVTTAKALSWAWKVPLIAVDHLEAHLEAAKLSGDAVQPPYLGVVLSGGHTDLYHVQEEQRERIGRTQDDAIGEAFDKVASVLGLPYPGGPAIEKCARDGDGTAVELPRTLLGKDSLNFSFSGLKTAVLYQWRGQDAKNEGPVDGAPAREDLCASFQAAAFDVVAEKVRRALEQTGLVDVVFGGGVVANRALREHLKRSLADSARSLVFPKLEFSTDNGAMIAAMGLAKLARGEVADLSLDARPSG